MHMVRIVGVVVIVLWPLAIWCDDVKDGAYILRYPAEVSEAYRAQKPFDILLDDKIIGYGILGELAQSTVLPGYGGDFCMIAAATALSYFLYRSNWDDITDDELSNIMVRAIAYGNYKAFGKFQAPQRVGKDEAPDVVQKAQDVYKRAQSLTTEAELAQWHFKRFLPEAEIAQVGEFHRYEKIEKSKPRDSEVLIKDLVHAIVEVAKESSDHRACALLTKATASRAVCYDRKAGRWLFYDSHRKPERSLKLANANVLVVSAGDDPITDTIDIASFFAGLPRSEAIRFALYKSVTPRAETVRAKYGTALPATFDDKRLQLYRAVQLLFENKYNDAVDLCRSLQKKMPKKSTLFKTVSLLEKTVSDQLDACFNIGLSPRRAHFLLTTLTSELANLKKRDMPGDKLPFMIRRLSVIPGCLSVIGAILEKQKLYATEDCDQQLVVQLTNPEGTSGAYDNFCVNHEAYDVWLVSHDALYPLVAIAHFIEKDLVDLLTAIADEKHEDAFAVLDRIEGYTDLSHAALGPALHDFMQKVRLAVTQAAAKA